MLVKPELHFIYPLYLIKLQSSVIKGNKNKPKGRIHCCISTAIKDKHTGIRCCTHIIQSSNNADKLFH